MPNVEQQSAIGLELQSLEETLGTACKEVGKLGGILLAVLREEPPATCKEGEEEPRHYSVPLANRLSSLRSSMAQLLRDVENLTARVDL